jgi:hypothetical protein
LESVIDQNDITPWQDVLPLLKESVVGYGYQDPWIRGRTSEVWIEESGFFDERINSTGRRLSKAELEELRKLNYAYTEAISPLAIVADGALRKALGDKLDRSDYIRCPLVGAGVAIKPGPGALGGWFRHVDSMSLRGWSILIEVDSQEYPDLDEHVTAIRDLSAERIKAISGYIDT